MRVLLPLRKAFENNNNNNNTGTSNNNNSGNSVDSSDASLFTASGPPTAPDEGVGNSAGTTTSGTTTTGTTHSDLPQRQEQQTNLHFPSPSNHPVASSAEFITAVSDETVNRRSGSTTSTTTTEAQPNTAIGFSSSSTQQQTQQQQRPTTRKRLASAVAVGANNPSAASTTSAGTDSTGLALETPTTAHSSAPATTTSAVATSATPSKTTSTAPTASVGASTDCNNTNAAVSGAKNSSNANTPPSNAVLSTANVAQLHDASLTSNNKAAPSQSTVEHNSNASSVPSHTTQHGCTSNKRVKLEQAHSKLPAASSGKVSKQQLSHLPSKKATSATTNNNHGNTTSNAMTGGGRNYKKNAPDEDEDIRQQVFTDRWMSNNDSSGRRCSARREESPQVNNEHMDNGDGAIREQDPLENEPPEFENRPHHFMNFPKYHHGTSGGTNIVANNKKPSASYSNHFKSTPTSSVANSDEDDQMEDTQQLSTTNENLFRMDLKKRGLEIVEQEGDGNCLFRAVSLQVYGDSSMHGEVRERCLDFMARDEAHFSQFVTGEPFATYVQRKRQLGVHGNNPEIQAISELFNRPVEVFAPARGGAVPLNIFHAEYKTADAPIRLSYHDGNHYNAVIDPLVPTAGLGLGLPGLQPGLADKLQVAKAVAESDQIADQMELERVMKQSEQDELQRAIKESTYSMDNMYKTKAMALSDLDATNFELEQAVLASSLDYRRNEHGRKQRAASGARRRRGANPTEAATTAAAQHPPLLLSSSSSSRTAQLPAVSESRSSVAAIPAAASMPDDTLSDHRGESNKNKNDNSKPNHPSGSTASYPTAAVAAIATEASTTTLTSSGPSSASQDFYASNGGGEEYPQTIQELVMNGFELRKVVHAYELIGDNFDDLLAFLMSNTAGANP